MVIGRLNALIRIPNRAEPDMTDFSPREIVHELDRHIIGQDEAKKAVAIALRNRWRRKRLPAELQEEVTPKNILMIGPTGVGKTEISRRLAKLAGAPFLKVEATKFTEVGYVGRDVDSIARDLVEVALGLVREKKREEVKASAHARAEKRVLDALVGENASESTRESFRKKLNAGDLDDKEIEIDLTDTSSPLGQLDIPGMGGNVSMVNLSDIFGKGFPQKQKKVRTTVLDAYEPLIQEEADNLIDDTQIQREAITLAENDGIVFLDEIDKIAARADARGADVSREGVQRDLLPLIEGATVATKYGPMKTDHVLFIASGAFHVTKPSDLLPELQGRLPIRVELKALTQSDLRAILTEPEASLVTQYIALMNTEDVTIVFEDSAIDAVAKFAAKVNSSVENIGARRLQTIMERLVEDISYTASDRGGETITIDAAYVEERVADLASNSDLSKFIL